VGDTRCTEAELLEAITNATQASGEEGLTGPEIARLTGLNIDRVRERLLSLKASGRIEVVRVLRVTLDDSQRHFPGYRVKKV